MRARKFQQLLEDFCERCGERTGAAVSNGEHYEEVARFLGVEARTLRRYRTGRAAIPRTVEIIALVMHRRPELTMSVIEGWLSEADILSEKK